MAILPLAGFTVGITADRRAEEQAELLRRRGANVVHGPVIRTLPLGSDAALRDVTERLFREPPHYVIANTGIGMRAWFAAAESWGEGDLLVDTLGKAQVFARGPKAAAVAHTAGLEVAWRAPSERLEEVIELLLEEPLRGARIAYQEHGDDTAGSIERLQAAGAEVIKVPVYRWILPDDTDPAQRLIEATAAGRMHAVTFTSAPAVRNFFAIAGRMQRADDVRAMFATRVLAACVGPVCAEQAHDDQIFDPVVPTKARLGLLVRAVCDRLAARAKELRVRGHVLRVQGNAAFVDGNQIDLSDREADVLQALTDRPGVVIGKQQLLREVWQGAANAHAVEVTVGRLRRRLGDVGDAVRVVPRRGYLLEREA